MTTKMLDEKLLYSAIEINKLYLIILSVLLIWLMVDFIYWKRTKSKIGVLGTWISKKSKSFNQRKAKMSLPESLLMGAVAAVMILVLLCIQMFPVFNDVRNDQYVQAQVIYNREVSQKNGAWFRQFECQIEVDGQQIELRLPANASLEEFPYGTTYGTVWYSEESKIILALSHRTGDGLREP